MRTLLAKCLSFTASRLKESVEPARLRAFAESELRRLSADQLSTRAKLDVAEAEVFLEGRAPAIHSTTPGEAALDWKKRIEGDKVVVSGRVVAGVGSALQALEHRGLETIFVRSCLERLMRHVEVKRQKSLALFTADLTPEQCWLEVHDLTIAFLEASATRKDLRYLNAALKLNDWSFPAYARGGGSAERRARYLRCIAEQEFRMSEAQRCV